MYVETEGIIRGIYKMKSIQYIIERFYRETARDIFNDPFPEKFDA